MAVALRYHTNLQKLQPPFRPSKLVLNLLDSNLCLLLTSPSNINSCILLVQKPHKLEPATRVTARHDVDFSGLVREVVFSEGWVRYPETLEED